MQKLSLSISWMVTWKEEMVNELHRIATVKKEKEKAVAAMDP